VPRDFLSSNTDTPRSYELRCRFIKCTTSTPPRQRENNGDTCNNPHARSLPVRNVASGIEGWRLQDLSAAPTTGRGTHMVHDNPSPPAVPSGRRICLKQPPSGKARPSHRPSPEVTVPVYQMHQTRPPSTRAPHRCIQRHLFLTSTCPPLRKGAWWLGW
jgi:hypothetical protein